MYILLGNNHHGNIFAEVSTIKTLFALAKPSGIANCRGEFRGLNFYRLIFYTKKDHDHWEIFRIIFKT